MDTKVTVYHEKQVKELCALHALNNLFQQQKCFTKQDLDNICYNLSPDRFVNPHKSMWGRGNYDINVIMAALQLKDHEAIWFDKRRDLRSVEPSNIKGFILNIPLYIELKLGTLQFRHKRQHWTCVRKISNSYYNLDSRLKNPTVIGDELDLVTFLKEQIENDDMELFLVMKKELAANESWIKSEFKTQNINTETDKKSNSAPIVESETATEAMESEESAKSAESNTKN